MRPMNNMQANIEYQLEREKFLFELLGAGPPVPKNEELTPAKRIPDLASSPEVRQVWALGPESKADFD